LWGHPFNTTQDRAPVAYPGFRRGSPEWLRPCAAYRARVICRSAGRSGPDDGAVRGRPCRPARGGRPCLACGRTGSSPRRDEEADCSHGRIVPVLRLRDPVAKMRVRPLPGVLVGGRWRSTTMPRRWTARTGGPLPMGACRPSSRRHHCACCSTVVARVQAGIEGYQGWVPCTLGSGSPAGRQRLHCW